MTLQILSFVKLSDKQIELIHQSYPHCQCRCIRPTEADDFLSNVDILLGYVDMLLRLDNGSQSLVDALV